MYPYIRIYIFRKLYVTITVDRNTILEVYMRHCAFDLWCLIMNLNAYILMHIIDPSWKMVFFFNHFWIWWFKQNAMNGERFRNLVFNKCLWLVVHNNCSWWFFVFFHLKPNVAEFWKQKITIHYGIIQYLTGIPRKLSKKK